MQDFEPRYLELMQGKLKLRRHRRGRVIRSYILQDQECHFSELRDQPGVFAFECQIGRERMVCQVETVQMVDTWMSAFNKCAEEEDNFSRPFPTCVPSAPHCTSRPVPAPSLHPCPCVRPRPRSWTRTMKRRGRR